MINPLKAFTTPEYLFRPSQILVRLQRLLAKPKDELERVSLPWGSQLKVRPHEVIGARIWFYGIFDLIVAEAIARLLDPGETALDIGANIGQMTSLMSQQAAPGGRVLAFEPHPELFCELSENCALNASRPGLASVSLHNVALSDRCGEAILQVNPSFRDNRGTCNVADEAGGSAAGLPIQLAELDSFLPASAQVGVCKIDVEGHELRVFRGAKSLMKIGSVRDIIYEDLDTYPTPLQAFFLQYGYTIFSLHTPLWGPALRPLKAQPAFVPCRDGENYLATRDPARAMRRFAGRGWRVLRGSAPPSA